MSDTPSQRQEKRSAQAWGGTVNPGSGNGWMRKNDVRTNRFSIECKSTAATSFRLRAEDLRKAHENALLDGKVLIFQVEMRGQLWDVIADEDLLELVGDP